MPGHRGHHKGKGKGASLSKSFEKAPFYSIVRDSFGVGLGFIGAQMIKAIYVFLFCGIGYYFLTEYNKEDTELLEEIQNGQYIGFVFIGIGVLPILDYILLGGGFELGSSLVSGITGDD